MSPLRSLIAVVAVGAVLVAAGVVTAGATPPPAQPRRDITVRVTSKHLVVAPKKVQPGIAHLRLAGASEVFLIQQKHAGVKRLVKDLNAQENSAGPGRLIKDFTLLTVLVPKSDVFLPLPRGTVFLADADLDHFKASEISTVAVAGPRVNDSVPTASAVTVSRNNLLHAAKTFPTTGYLHLRSRSTALQEILVVEVGKNVTTATLKNFVAHPDLDKLEDISPRFQLSFIGIVGGRSSLWGRQHSHAGRDVVLNIPLRPTTGDTKLHKGQARVVTVTS